MGRVDRARQKLNLGIIVGDVYDSFLSLDHYVNHYLLPFSPRFRSIDFALASLDTIGIDQIFIFTQSNKEFVARYLMREWPFHTFHLFDNLDLIHEFEDFFQEYAREKRVQSIAVIRGDYPVWFDFNQAVEKWEGRAKIMGVEGSADNQKVVPSIIIDRNSLLKHLKSQSDYAQATGTAINMNPDTLVEQHKASTIEVSGYFKPLKNIQHYYDIHIDMLDDYHFLDHFHAQIPVKGSRQKNNRGTLMRGSHCVNSIIGENTEIAGKIENSVIFSRVKIDPKAEVVNSIILPGNHIGPKVKIRNAIIDEFSGDNSLPNIEKLTEIGSDRKRPINQDFPKQLNFGVTLIGKDIFIPPRSKFAANCYVESFLTGARVKKNNQLSEGQSLLDRR